MGMASVPVLCIAIYIPEEDWKAYEYVDMPECWYIKKMKQIIHGERLISFSLFAF